MIRRLLGACLVVLALIAAAVGLDDCASQAPFGEPARSGQALDGADCSNAAGDGAAAGGNEDASKAMLAALSADSVADALGFTAPLPAGFESEVIGTAEFDEVLVADGGATVGLLGRGTASRRYAELCAELEGKGWVAVQSGQGGVSTFIKGEGAYTWLLLACSEVDGWVGVVVQVR